MRAIYRVTAPMPEIGALPGDLLHAEPGNPDFPLSLTRQYDRNVLPVVLDQDRVTQVWSNRPQLEVVR